MTNKLLGISLAVLFIGTHCSCFSQSSYVTIKGKRFMLGGEEYYPKVLNYGIDIVWDGSSGHYIAPHHGSSCKSVEYTCSTSAACSLQVASDLKYIANTMGFDAIRLVGLNANKEEEYPDCSSTYLNGLSVRVFDSVPNKSWLANLAQTGAPHNPSNITQATVLNLISQVLTLANNVELRVILWTGGGNVCKQESRDELENYFSTVAATFANNTALMAYDLINEPGNWDGANFNKQSVCTTVARWYDAIKANDQQHLITIGFTDAGIVHEWDPGALKLDFASFHPYPFILYDDNNQHNPSSLEITDGFNRVFGQIYWTQKNISLPWMLGETGFLGSDASNAICSPAAANYGNSREGTESDQQKFVQETMDKTRDCGGAGYSYWWFQDTHNYGNYHDLTGLVYTDGAHDGNYVVQDPYYTDFGSYNAIPQKPCSLTANYLNQHPSWTSNHTFGFVKDNNGAAIGGAVVTGWSGWNNPVQNFTDANGRFDLYNNGSTGAINIVRAGAVGSNVITIVTFSPGATINLTFAQQHRDIALGATTISYPMVVSHETFKGIVTTGGSMYVVNGNGSTGGDVTFKAGREITLKDGFEVRRGGTFHAFDGTPTPNCNDGAFNYTLASEGGSDGSLVERKRR